MMVDAGADVYLCHDFTTRVWHSAAEVDGKPLNRTRLAICIITDRRPTPEMIRATAKACVWAERELAILRGYPSKLIIDGHQDYYATSCPGIEWPVWRKDLERWIEEIR